MNTPLEIAEAAGENTDAFCGWCGQEHDNCEHRVVRDLYGLASSHVDRLHADASFGTEEHDATLARARKLFGIPE